MSFTLSPNNKRVWPIRCKSKFLGESMETFFKRWRIYYAPHTFLLSERWTRSLELQHTFWNPEDKNHMLRSRIRKVKRNLGPRRHSWEGLSTMHCLPLDLNEEKLTSVSSWSIVILIGIMTFKFETVRLYTQVSNCYDTFLLSKSYWLFSRRLSIGVGLKGRKGHLEQLGHIVHSSRSHSAPLPAPVMTNTMLTRTSKDSESLWALSHSCFSRKYGSVHRWHECYFYSLIPSCPRDRRGKF